MRSIHIASPSDASSTGPRGPSFDRFPRRAKTRVQTQNGTPNAANFQDFSNIKTCFCTREMHVICSKEPPSDESSTNFRLPIAEFRKRLGPRGQNVKGSNRYLSYHNRNVPVVSTIEMSPSCGFTQLRKRRPCFSDESLGAEDDSQRGEGSGAPDSWPAPSAGDLCLTAQSQSVHLRGSLASVYVNGSRSHCSIVESITYFIV
jgi:hypothetical protein